MAGLDTLTDAGINVVPQFDAGKLGLYFLYFIVGVVVAGIVVVGIIYVINYLKWNIKIVLFKKINNVVIPVNSFKGMLQRIGKAGDHWLATKKVKKRLPRPQIWMGKQLVWYYERQDGEWINFSIRDIDEDMKKAGAYYVDEDMRLQRLGIEKNLEQLKTEGFWKKHGPTIMIIMGFMLMLIAVIVVFNQIKEMYSAITQSANAIKDLALALESTSRGIHGGVVPV